MIGGLTLRKTIELAVTTEEIGEKFYSQLAQKYSGKKEVAELFTTLAKDERIHREKFKDLLAKVADKKDDMDDEHKSQYLTAMATNEFFAKNKGPFKNIDAIQDYNEALSKAFELEKATLGFYQAIEDVLGPHEILTKIIDSEKLHVVNIMKIMIAEGKLRSLEDKW